MPLVLEEPGALGAESTPTEPGTSVVPKQNVRSPKGFYFEETEAFSKQTLYEENESSFYVSSLRPLRISPKWIRLMENYTHSEASLLAWIGGQL